MIPIGDSARSRHTPWVNYGIILVNVLVFAFSLTLSQDPPSGVRERRQDYLAQQSTICYGHDAAPTDIDEFYCRWSFQPREWFDNAEGDARTGPGRDPLVLVSVVTALFLHAGWLHVLGNMLFLWVFGDNVEDRLGHFAYAAFYIAGGVVASLIQGLADPQSVVPVVGASGAVAAVLGAYLVWFPGATVIAVIPPLLFLPLPIPAVLMIGVWFLQNLLAGYATLGSTATPSEAVAWFAHIGGFLFGLVFVLLFLRRRGSRRRQSPVYT